MNLQVVRVCPQGSQDSSHVEPCKSTLLSSRKSSVRLPIGWTIGIVGFLSRCHRAVSPAIVFGPRVERRVSAGESGVSGVHWDNGGLLKWCHDPWSSSQVSSGNSLLLRCDGNTGITSPMKQGNGPTSQREDGEPGLFVSCDGTFGVPLECRRGCRGTS